MISINYRLEGKLIYRVTGERSITLTERRDFDFLRFRYATSMTSALATDGITRRLERTVRIETVTPLDYEIDDLIEIKGEGWRITAVERKERVSQLLGDRDATFLITLVR